MFLAPVASSFPRPSALLLVIVGSLGLAGPARADHREGDLIVRSVDASGVTWDCASAQGVGSVSATLAWSGKEPPRTAARILIFEDRDRDGAFDTTIDQRLCETVAPAFGAPVSGLIADVVATCPISASFAFSEAHISALVDSAGVIAEEDETNNVTHSGFSREFPPALINWSLTDEVIFDQGETVSQQVVVGHFTDDNGDGRIDTADDPSLVYVVFPGDPSLGGVIRILNPRTGVPLASTSPTGKRTRGNLALADLDDNGKVEIITVKLGAHHLLSYELDSSGALIEKWESDDHLLRGFPGAGGQIAIANLDRTGPPEIIVGAAIFSATGQFLADGGDPPLSGANGYIGPFETGGSTYSSVSDVNSDGYPDIVAGGTAYTFRGGRLRFLWHRPYPDVGDAMSAVGDLDDDGLPEVVLVRYQWYNTPRIRVLEGATGADDPAWLGDGGVPGWLSVTAGPQTSGGPPSIGDLDGDGDAEFVVATQSTVLAYDQHGTQLWARSPWSDESGYTAAALFDFDGDGTLEVVVRDGYTLRVGPGTELPADWLLNRAAVQSFTGIESPVIADLNHDGHAEIISMADFFQSELSGVHVFSNPTWVGARSVWGQASYHVSEIGDDMSIPRREAARWRVAPPGDWRRQITPHGCLRPAPDLTVSWIAAVTDPCVAAGSVTVRVGNAGAAVARDFVVALRADDDPAPHDVTPVIPRLAPGEWIEVTLDVPVGATQVIITADDDTDVDEYDEANNSCAAPVGRGCTPSWEPATPVLEYLGDLTGDHHDPVLLKAQLRTPETAVPGVGIVGVFVRFELGAQKCADVTDADGMAQCWVSPSEAAGPLALSAVSDATPSWNSATAPLAPNAFNVTLEQALLTFDAPLVQPAWTKQASLSATLREDGALALGSRPVAFEVGGAPAFPAGVDTNASGKAGGSASVAWGDNIVTAAFAPDATHVAAGTGDVILHALAPQFAMSPLAQVSDSALDIVVEATLLDDDSTEEIEVKVDVISGPSASEPHQSFMLEAGETAPYTYTPDSSSGTDIVRAWYDLNDDDDHDSGEPYADAEVILLRRLATEVELRTSPLGGDYTDAKAVTLRLKEAGTGTAIAGAALEMALDGAPCRGITDSSGDLTCRVTPQDAPTLTLAATFTGDPQHAPPAAPPSWTFNVSREQTRLTWWDYSSVAIPNTTLRSYTFRVRLTADGVIPLHLETVVFTVDGVPSNAQTNAGIAQHVAILSTTTTHSVTAAFPATAKYEGQLTPIPQQVVTVGQANPTSFAWNVNVQAPGNPTLVEATPRGDGTIEVTFTPPTTAGVPPLTGYLITVDGGLQVSVSAAEAPAGSPASRYITGLTNRDTHAFVIKTVSDVASSSGVSDDTATSTIPAGPASVSAIGNNGTNAIDVSWTHGGDGGSDIIGARLSRLPAPATALPDITPASTVTYADTSIIDGVPHAYWARSYNANGNGPWSARTTPVQTIEPPSEPLALKFVPMGDDEVRIYWKQPASLGGAKVSAYQLRKDTVLLGAAFTPGADDLTVIVGGSNGEPMDLTLAASNDGVNFGPESAVLEATPRGVPGEPSITVARDNGAVLVGWPVAPDDSGSDITGYTAGAGTLLPSLTSPEPGPDPGSRMVTGLSNGDPASLRLVAVNDVGTSLLSEAADKVPARNPEKPTWHPIVSVGPGSVTLRWSEPPVAADGPGDGGAIISNYLITAAPDLPATEEWSSSEVAVSGVVEDTIVGLTNGRPYRFFIRAVNDVTAPEFGAMSDASDVAIPCGTPQDPLSVVASIAGDTKLRVRWLPPEDDGGVAVSAYDVHMRVGAGAWTSIGAALSPSTRQLTVGPDGLVPGDEVRFRITVHTGAGCGASDLESSPITVATLPAIPSVGTPTGDDETVTITWTALGSGAESGHADLLGYQVCPIPGDAPCVDVPAGVTTATVTGLDNGVTYKLRVRGRNVVGLGDPATSGDATPCGDPWPPLNLRTEQTGNGELTVRWDAPGWTGGCAITGYKLYEGAALITTTAWDDLEHEVTGLTACADVEFSVRAVAGSNESELSDPVTGIPAGPPSEPLQVVGYPGDGRAQICWLPPTSDGCAPVLEYAVHLTDGTMDHDEVADAAATCVSVTGLTNGVPYDIEVRARNVAGLGSPGVPAPPAPIPATVTPMVPTLDRVEVFNLVENTEGFGQVVLTSTVSTATPLTLTPSGPVSLPDGTTVTVQPGSGIAYFRIKAGWVNDPLNDDLYDITAELIGGGTEMDTAVVEDDATAACTIEVTSPADGGEVFDYETPLTASVECELGTPSWTVEWRLVDAVPDAWLPVTCSPTTGTSINCLLDPTLQLNGQHEIRITVSDGLGGSATETRRVVVTGQQKIGHFSLSFVDMTIPVAGMPIQVIRSYDSRDPRDGDFGVGWRLAMKDVRVEINRPLDTEWLQVNHSCGLGCYNLSNNCVEETRSHVVSVTFPDGRVYRFQPAFSRTAEPGASCAWSEALHGWIHFVPVGATRASLVPIDDVIPDDPRRVQITPAGTLTWEDGNETLGETTDEPFAPELFALTTEDGRVWNVTIGDGLQSVTDRNGNWIAFSSTGTITSSSGATVTVTRDGSDHVESITDPRGNAAEYEVTGSRLVRYFDRASVAASSTWWTAFDYTDTTFPYYLTGIEQVGSGTAPPYTLTDYDSDGRVEQICQVVNGTPHCTLLDHTAIGVHETITDIRGFPTTLHYDDRGRVTQRDDAMGWPWATEDYTDDDQPIKEIDPLGHETNYGYDPSTGDLLMVTDHLNNATAFAWTDKRGLREVDTPLLAPTSFTYDPKGNLRVTKDPAGHETFTDVNSDGHVEHVRNAMGQESFTTWEGPVAIEKIDAAGHRTRYDHDLNLNVILTVRESDEGDLITEFQYDADDRLIRTVSPDGSTKRTTYDDFGRATVHGEATALNDPDDPDDDTFRDVETVFDDFGRPWLTRYPDGTASLTLHDFAGNVIQEESRVPRYPNGDPSDTDDPPFIRRHGFDALGREYKTCIGGTSNVEDEMAADEDWALGCSWKGFDKAGRLVAEKDERGYLTIHEYDVVNRPTRSCMTAGVAEAPTYPFDGLTCTSYTLASDVATGYDTEGRVMWTKVPGLAWQVPHYDAAGRRQADCRQSQDPEGAAGIVLDDPRLSSDDDPDAVCRAFEHDDLGRVIAEVDEDGHRTEFSLLPNGPMDAVTDAALGVTTYGFDDFGRMVSQQDALGRVTRYEHHPSGQRSARVLPLLQREIFEHTLAGELQNHVDFSGRQTTHVIDDDTGRVTSSDYPDDPMADADLAFTYFGDGTRRSVEDESGITAYTRADNGRDIELTQRPGQPDLAHVFDEDGRRIETTVDGATPDDTFHDFDAVGRLASVEDDAVGGTGAVYGWDLAGRLETVTYKTGGAPRVTGAYAHDVLTGALRSITWTATAGPPEPLRLVYELDDDDDDDATPPGESAGRRTGVDEYRSGVLFREVDYGFDALHRLTRETVTAGGDMRVTTFEYDAVGNRVRQTVTLNGNLELDEISTVDENDQLISVDRWGVEDLELTWDENGNLTGKSSGETYTWDVRDRLLLVENAPEDGPWDFRYDADGLKRTSDSSASDLTTHVVDGTYTHAQVIEERESGVVAARYLRGLHPVRIEADGQQWWYLHDALGSTRALVAIDASGAVTITDEWDFKAFGEEDGYRPLGATAACGERNRWLFAGEERIEGIELDYLRARWMEPASGRFTSLDPAPPRLASPETLSRYAYGGGNPAANIDSAGRDFDLATTTASAGIGGTLAAGWAGMIGYVESDGDLEHATLEACEAYRQAFVVTFALGGAAVAGGGVWRVIGPRMFGANSAARTFFAALQQRYAAIFAVLKAINSSPSSVRWLRQLRSPNCFDIVHYAEHKGLPTRMGSYEAGDVGFVQVFGKPSGVGGGSVGPYGQVGVATDVSFVKGGLPPHYAVRNLDGTITDSYILANIEQYATRDFPTVLRNLRDIDTFTPQQYELLLQIFRDAVKFG